MRRLGGDGQGDRKRRSAARLRLERESPAVMGDDIATDGQPEPCALWLAGQRIADLLELLEDPLLIGGGDADAGVCNRNVHLLGMDGCTQRHTSRGGELHRVIEQVVYDLLDTIAIAPNRRKVFGDLLPKVE